MECNLQFPPKFQNYKGEWFTNYPVLKTVEPPANSYRPSERLERMRQAPDWSQMGLYKDEDLLAVHLYQEQERMMLESQYETLAEARRANEANYGSGGNYAGNAGSPQYGYNSAFSWWDPISWPLSGFWEFVETYGNLAAIFVAFMTIIAILIRIAKLCYMGTVLHEIYGCTTQLFFLPCMEIFQLRKYRRLRRAHKFRRASDSEGEETKRPLQNKNTLELAEKAKAEGNTSPPSYGAEKGQRTEEKKASMESLPPPPASPVPSSATLPPYTENPYTEVNSVVADEATATLYPTEALSSKLNEAMYQYRLQQGQKAIRIIRMAKWAEKAVEEEELPIVHPRVPLPAPPPIPPKLPVTDNVANLADRYTPGPPTPRSGSYLSVIEEEGAVGGVANDLTSEVVFSTPQEEYVNSLKKAKINPIPPEDIAILVHVLKLHEEVPHLLTEALKFTNIMAPLRLYIDHTVKPGIRGAALVHLCYSLRQKFGLEDYFALKKAVIAASHLKRREHESFDGYARPLTPPIAGGVLDGEDESEDPFPSRHRLRVSTEVEQQAREQIKRGSMQ